MQEVTVTSLAEFITGTVHSENELIFSSFLFRGQPEKWELLPGIARTRTIAKAEKKMLEQLKLQGSSFLNGVGPTDLDILVLAQHSGLMTRLLDWTSNPLAALWFACTGAEDGDVLVYMLIADFLLDEDVYNNDPFAIAENGVRGQACVFQPRLNNARIIAQHGWFTLHRPDENGIFVPLEQHPQAANNMIRFRIQKSMRSHILDTLDMLGVNAKTLFPDLDGLCRHLKWKHQLA